MPVSSSASTTIRPEMMWRPPANRSVAETSALRHDVLSTLSRASSSFTCAVNAMPSSCHHLPVAGAGPDIPEGPLDHITQRRGQPQRVVTRGSVPRTDLSEQQSSTERIGPRDERPDVPDPVSYTHLTLPTNREV